MTSTVLTFFYGFPFVFSLSFISLSGYGVGWLVAYLHWELRWRKEMEGRNFLYDGTFAGKAERYDMCIIRSC